MKKTLTKKIEALMREETIASVPHFFLYLASLIYGAAVRARRALYSIGVLKTRRLPCRVVSIGNITVGGTGKTPLAILVAGLVQKDGCKAVILSRGYKRKSKGLVVVSDYASMLAGPQEAGDEPYLMAKRLPGVAVVVSSDRAGAGRYACERFKPDYIILDDGFQHIRLERDVNILLVDGRDGFGNGHLLPAGILREPVVGAARSGLVMVKNKLPHGKDSDAIRGLGLPVMRFTYRSTAIIDLKDGSVLKTGLFKGKKAVAVAGLANPAGFYKTLEGLGIKVVKTLSYPDHHWFSVADVGEIKKTAVEAGAVVIMTEKDGVRLAGLQQGGVEFYSLSIDAVVQDYDAFDRLITGKPR